MAKNTSTTQQGVEAPQTGAQTSPEPTTPGTDPKDVEQTLSDAQEGAKGGGNKEAAKYRRQLRDTEAEKDDLAGQVEGLRRQLVQLNMPHGSKTNADALWATGRNAGDFFNDAGQLDAEKLTAAVRETHTALGLRYGPDVISESGTGNGGMEPKRATWSDALKRRR